MTHSHRAAQVAGFQVLGQRWRLTRNLGLIVHRQRDECQTGFRALRPSRPRLPRDSTLSAR